MRSVLGFVAVHAVLASAGMALLFAAGLVTRVRQLPWALGPAYLCGLAVVMPVLVLILVLGGGVRLPQFVVTAALATIGLAAVGVRRARRADTPADGAGPAAPADGAAPWIGRAAAAVFGLYFALGATAFAKLGTANDDMAIWSYKALGFFYYDGTLEPHVINPHGPVHLDYPVLQPLLESIFFRAMGDTYLQEWHIALWVLFGCFAWSVAFLMRSAGAPALSLLAPVAVLALLPEIVNHLGTGYADVTVACFVALAALALGLWLEAGRGGYAVLAGLLLAAAANTKNEGIAFAGALLLAAAVVAAVTRAGRRRTWAAAAGIAIAGALPWIQWRSGRHLADGDVTPVREALDPGFLADRFDRVQPAASEVLERFAAQGAWTWVVPCFLALALVAIWTGEGRRLAAFYLGAGALMTAALLWVYWTGNIPIERWLAFSASRTVTSVILVAAMGLVHLSARMLGPLLRADPATEP
jgi:hypothetical protein